MVAEVLPIADAHRENKILHRSFDAQRRAFSHNTNPSLETRRENLLRLKRLLLDNQERFVETLNADFSSRSRDETLLAEFMPAIQGINYSLANLAEWMKPSARSTGLLFMPGSNRVEYQPKGVVGVVVPWNYPLNLAISPVVTAMAAGNRVMVKMSEFTPATSALLHEIISNSFSEDLISVITGDASVAAEFCRLPFDHLLFTGSTNVGKLVMKSAAENLTPVTLELGGKSPVIVGEDVPLSDAAERIAFGKSFNAGQTCIAPDYVLCPHNRLDAFVDEYRTQFHKLYPSLKDNQDYTAIINDRQLQRLKNLVLDAENKGATVVVLNPANEDFDRGTRKMPLHLILNATTDMKVMQEEIFGPVLPILGYGQLDEAIRFINERPRPLALYYFGYRKTAQQRVLEQTHSGGVCINDTLMHFAQDDMPFGGVGESGMGHYHGIEGFRTFSHAKAIHMKGRINSGRAIFPPHGSVFHELIYKIFIR